MELIVWSGNRHSPSQRPFGTWVLFSSICSLGPVKPRFQGILLCASQLTEQLFTHGGLAAQLSALAMPTVPKSPPVTQRD